MYGMGGTNGYCLGIQMSIGIAGIEEESFNSKEP